MKKIPLLFALCAVFCASATAILAESSSTETASLQSEIVASPLNGILIYGSWDQVRKEPVADVNGVQSKGVSLLASHPGFLKKLQDEFVGLPLTQGALWKLKSDISEFYCKQDQPFVVVSVPRQNMSKGILQVVVDEAILGNITVKGNKYYTPDRLKSFLNVQPGSPIDGKQLVKDMARMNQNPFRRTDAIFRPGKKPGTADLELATIDRWPHRFYMGADNT